MVTNVGAAGDASSAGNVLLSTAADINTVPFTVETESWLIIINSGAAATGTIKSSIEIAVD